MPPDPTLILGPLDLIAGIVLMAVAVPLIRRRIPPNRWYGIRIRAAFESEEAWYRINAHGGKSLLAMGLATAVLGALDFFVLPASSGPALIIAVALLPGLFLVPMLVHIYRYPRSPEIR